MFACRRFDANTNRLVLVNLSDHDQSYPASGAVLAAIGDVQTNETGTELAPYAGVILDLN